MGWVKGETGGGRQGVGQGGGLWSRGAPGGDRGEAVVENGGWKKCGLGWIGQGVYGRSKDKLKLDRVG